MVVLHTTNKSTQSGTTESIQAAAKSPPHRQWLLQPRRRRRQRVQLRHARRVGRGRSRRGAGAVAEEAVEAAVVGRGGVDVPEMRTMWGPLDS